MATYSAEPYTVPHGPPEPYPVPHGLPGPEAYDQDVEHGHVSSSGERSPLAFFKNLNPEKKQTKDGNPPKRRGPKPDSKPALTRRQELNRQAQRTHRERKEMYIKALEQEVLRLKDVFANTIREKDAVLDENRRLKELLAQHGISYDFGASPLQFNREDSNNGYGPSSSGSISGSYRGATDSSGFSPPPGIASQLSQQPNMNAVQASQSRSRAQLPSNRLDYDSLGIDFVLTLERPCMDHMQYLMVRSHNPEGQPFHHPMENPDDLEHEHMSGHALMATGPSWSHITRTPAEKYPHQMPAKLDNTSLVKLMDLSSRIPFSSYDTREGEITPVMAWAMIYGNDRMAELDKTDIERIKANLSTKVRCYGFGAVVEEFEVRDALSLVLAEKDGSLLQMMEHALSSQQIAAY